MVRKLQFLTQLNPKARTLKRNYLERNESFKRNMEKCVSPSQIIKHPIMLKKNGTYQNIQLRE